MKAITHDKVSIVFIVLFFVSLGASAQERYFYGGVFDAATRMIVDSVKVTLFSEDGVAQDSMVTDKNVKVGYDNATWYFWCGKHVPKGKLQFSAAGYEDREIEFPAISFKSRETMRQMPNVYLRRKTKEQVLGEAVVQATKIKFYHKGDTLVFNADAFEIGEGSMLDALIRQLPGVELKKGGEIFVLDMGSPVKIDTLARNLIRLSGFKPDIDIKVQYSGLRPGEKLYEEKLMAEEGLQNTANERIHIGKPLSFDIDAFLGKVDDLMEAAYKNKDDIREMVKDIVGTYKPAE